MQNVMHKYPEVPAYFLKIGEGGIFDQPSVISTVLGSCVTVTFHCARTKTGALFHAILPKLRTYEKKPDDVNPYKYVDSAIICLHRSLKARGIRMADVETKVFGGAGILLEGQLSSGQANVKVAFETLAALKMKVLATDVGGDRGRRLVFISHTGEVYIRTHSKNLQNT